MISLLNFLFLQWLNLRIIPDVTDGRTLGFRLVANCKRFTGFWNKLQYSPAEDHWIKCHYCGGTGEGSFTPCDHCCGFGKLIRVYAYNTEKREKLYAGIQKARTDYWPKKQSGSTDELELVSKIGKRLRDYLQDNEGYINYNKLTKIAEEIIKEEHYGKGYGEGVIAKVEPVQRAMNKYIDDVEERQRRFDGKEQQNRSRKKT